MDRKIHAKWLTQLYESGYAGVNKAGTIVDRRIEEDAEPLQENRLYGIHAPKRLEKEYV